MDRSEINLLRTIIITPDVVDELELELDDNGVGLHVEAVAPDLRYSLLVARYDCPPSTDRRVELCVYGGVKDDWSLGLGNSRQYCDEVVPLDEQIREAARDLDKMLALRGVGIKLGGRGHD